MHPVALYQELMKKNKSMSRNLEAVSQRGERMQGAASAFGSHQPMQVHAMQGKFLSQCPSFSVHMSGLQRAQLSMTHRRCCYFGIQREHVPAQRRITRIQVPG